MQSANNFIVLNIREYLASDVESHELVQLLKLL